MKKRYGIIKDNLKRIYYHNIGEKLRDKILQLRNPIYNPNKIYRPYFDKTKTIYIHIPKVAGTSIGTALYGEDPYHYCLSSFEVKDEKKFSYYFKFSFVRNPWDRIVSSYLYAKKSYLKDKYHSLGFIALYENFENFVINWVNRDNVNNHYFFFPQMKYITNLKGDIGLDFLGKYENIDSDFRAICQKIGIDAVLPLLNKTEHSHYSDYYSSKTKDIIFKVYKDDIQMLNYDF
ncbi:MAG: sulfotransferase family 2 domain-containing protein [Desulfococcaceae bacterium]